MWLDEPDNLKGKVEPKRGGWGLWKAEWSGGGEKELMQREDAEIGEEGCEGALGGERLTNTAVTLSASSPALFRWLSCLVAEPLPIGAHEKPIFVFVLRACGAVPVPP